jgi:ribosomal protein L40E
MQNLALERNNPNLTLEVLERENHQSRNSGSRQRQTYKTKIADEEESHRKNLTCNPIRWCVLHEKPHTLAKCRALLGKSLEDRKNLLRKNQICFCCVASTTHVAKDCRSTVKCLEYQSDKHLTIMHAGAKGIRSKISER